MATLIKDIADLKEYVSVNQSLDWNSVKPYIKQAERKYISPITGTAMYTAYSAEGFDPSGNPALVFELLKEASANLAWFLYLPLANVEVTDNGITVTNGEHHKSAEWWHIRDLRRSFLDAGFSALDEALAIMEINENDFMDWKASTGYTHFKELFVKRTDTFQRWFNISNSRLSFLALRPYMLEAHHQYFTAQLNAATIATINHLDKPPATLSLELAGGTPYRVLEHLQAAMVAYTVAKAVQSGTFEVTDTGIYKKMAEFPGYKVSPLEDAQVYRIAQDRIVSAEEHFKKALKLIASDPENFPDYETKAASELIKPYNTKSTVSF